MIGSVSNYHGFVSEWNWGLDTARMSLKMQLIYVFLIRNDKAPQIFCVLAGQSNTASAHFYSPCQGHYHNPNEQVFIISFKVGTSLYV